jgi:lipoprotein-anchoring transpeptidase ErfK/SrfK
MYRIVLAAGLTLAAVLPANAQSWVPWRQPSLLDEARPQLRLAPKPPVFKQKKQTARSRAAPLPPSAARPPATLAAVAPDDALDGAPPAAPIVVDGGPRPDISPKSPSRVTFSSGQPKGTIVIDSRARRLYLVQSSSTALSYPVSVGREGFSWKGTERISRVAQWPDWHPPAEMRQRDPRLPEKMTGGIRNPLGAKALYLGSTLYRIHGTSDARSIGRAASSGCFRMLNGHVVDLAGRVGVGTKVVVVNVQQAQVEED